MGTEKDTLLDAKSGHNYDRRHIVARCGVQGHFLSGHIRHTIWRYVTFKMPDGQTFAAEFVSLAPIDKYGFLRNDKLNIGDIILMPGLLYRKMLAMPGGVLLAHMEAMKTWKPPTPQLVPMIDTETAPVDVGGIYLRKPH